MNKILIASFLSLQLIIFSGFVLNDSKLQVEITGFESKASTKIWVSIFSKKDFLETPLQTKSVTVSGSEVQVEFSLSPGEYAISTYQDLNGNLELDRYFFGKPKEPYGFSNNIVPSIGPPDYDDCKFTLSNSSNKISIKLIE